MFGPLHVSPESISAPSPHDAAGRVASLVRADAAVSGMSGTEIDMQVGTAAAGGGAEGIARGAPRQSLYGLVKKGTTAYMIRSDRFVPGRGVADLPFARTGAAWDEMRSRAGQGGTLVVLLTGWDDEDCAECDVVGSLRQALAEGPEPCAHARIDVWGRNRIAAAMEKFPSLALGTGEGAGARLYSHAEWSSLGDMSYTFMSGGAEEEFIAGLRERLRKGDASGPVHVHVSGGPGSGKTRLVLEATRAAGLAPRIVYAEDPPAGESFLCEITRRPGGGRWAAGAAPILVVDGCDPGSRASFWNILMNNREGVHLVTIDGEPDEFAGGAELLPVGGMDDEQIEGILLHHVGGKGIEVGEWVGHARPSPRAAHIVGANLSSDPLNMFAAPGNVNVWKRWIAGGGRRYSGAEYEDRYTVLLWLSLFTEFGFDAPHKADAAAIAGMVRAHHPGMQEWRFREIVGALSDAGVVQGRPILRITPRLLHDYLWLKWWERYDDEDAPSAADLAAGGGVGIESRSKRYCGMLARMRDRPEARAAVERQLGPGGLFGRREDLRRSLEY